MEESDLSVGSCIILLHGMSPAYAATQTGRCEIITKIERTSVRSLGFDLQALEIFEAVCRTGSMTAAANEFGLTQSAVSRTVAVLEDRLSTQLLQRDCRPLKTTAAGHRLQDAAVDLIQRTLSLPASVRGKERRALGSLRLGILDSLADPFVPKVIEGLREIAASVAVSTAFDASLREGFLRHEFEAVVSTSAYDELNGFDHYPVFRESYIVVAPAGKRPFENLESFRRFAAKSPLVRFGKNSSMATRIDQHLRRMKLDIIDAYSCNTIESVIGLVASGVGWSIITPVCVRKCLHLVPLLQLLQLPGPSFERSVFFATRKGELGPHASKAALVCRNVIRDIYIPDLLKVAPWLSEALTVDPVE